MGVRKKKGKGAARAGQESTHGEPGRRAAAKRAAEQCERE